MNTPAPNEFRRPQGDPRTPQFASAHHRVDAASHAGPAFGPAAAEAVRYSVVIPVYNEEAVLPVTYERLKPVMDQLGHPYEILFVDDGSQDTSGAWLTSLAQRDAHVRVLHFSRNFGHQAAITAGIDYARGAAVIVMDADLQDPPELIPELIAKWQQGYDVVYAQRTRRRGEGVWKRTTAAAFYRVLGALTDIQIPMDTGDFRLMDATVCQVLRKLDERGRFVRGLVAWVGFRQTAVPYVRDPRYAGATKYPLRRMLRLAGDAVTSFSTRPLLWPLYLGALAMAIGLGLALATLVEGMAGGAWPVVLWLTALIIGLSGIELSALGVLGQYVARIHSESRRRPLYVVAGKDGFDDGLGAET
ncbi:glycosyltransferase family 2 protein [Alicyclobacillus shizuokensis]|uniref:glycosyltransferase family 2 protein n=1 Tax=Alicyclobacillus shizuokensis TaxID=392014 RepID=UPI0009F9FA9C|nr:glycosyltransferase family 2 protein [Alicyclobacillus shizuokensis]